MASTSGHRPRSWLALLTITLVVGGCASPAPTAGRALAATPTAVPTEVATPGPTEKPPPEPSVAAENPTQRPSPTPMIAQWVTLGTISRMAFHPDGLVAFKKGYVAANGYSMAYFSRDGIVWKAVRLPGPADFRSADSQPQGLASNGTRVVIVGGYGHEPCAPVTGATGEGPNCVQSPVSWVSDDGVTWRTSLPWVGPVGTAAGFRQGSEFSSVWAVPGGWEAALFYWAGEGQYQREIWSSPDGVTWRRAAIVSDVGADVSAQRMAIVDNTGRRLLWSTIWACRASSDCRNETRLWTSSDGIKWQTIPAPLDMSIVHSGLPPGQADTPWMLAGATCDRIAVYDCHVAVWLSRDLRTWSDVSLPRGFDALDWGLVVARAPGGYVLVAWWGDVASPRQATWVSSDGIGWTALPNPPLVWTASAGPAGTLGIGGAWNITKGTRPIYVLR